MTSNPQALSKLSNTAYLSPSTLIKIMSPARIIIELEKIIDLINKYKSESDLTDCEEYCDAAIDNLNDAMIILQDSIEDNEVSE